MARMLSLVAGLALGRYIVQKGQQQRCAIVSADPTRRKPKPAVTAMAIGQALLDQPRRLVAGCQGGQPLRATLLQIPALFGRQVADQVVAQHLLRALAQHLKKSPVGGPHHKTRVLHRQRLG